MQIITGKTGTEHVTAEDDRALHAATFGTGNFVLDIGSKFSARVETSNNIVISNGELMMNGTHARIRYGETETVVIENGTTGYNRIDLIVARYKKQSGIESVELAVIKGETTSGTAKQPSYTTGNILEGDELAEMPLYAVKLEGVNVVSVTPLFTIVTGMNDVYRKDEVYSKDDALSKDNIVSVEASSNKSTSPYVNIKLPDGFTKSNTILLGVKWNFSYSSVSEIDLDSYSQIQNIHMENTEDVNGITEFYWASNGELILKFSSDLSAYIKARVYLLKV